jgi:hypothetical protein
MYTGRANEFRRAFIWGIDRDALAMAQPYPTLGSEVKECDYTHETLHYISHHQCMVE